MSTQPHYFIAVNLPIEIKEKIKEAREGLKHSFPFKKWVHPLDYHLTLAFLGSSSKEQLQTLINLLHNQIHKERSFYLQISTLGFFGDSDKPRVFWLGVKEEKKLHSLRNRVYEECGKSEFTLEKRTFHPHITLARKWEGENFSRSMLNEKNLLEEKLAFQVDSIQLFQTHVEKEPKYEAIYTFRFSEG
ncbi:RNA 2',3'-cyclic phosphodiesterase [Niallia sp. 03133]|uniref:RNA 2',3'-cyclic phosphodiesterase n=1 Tax=Niallia sp. 03133 TaxID=3458060 RepID=UPI0040447AF8